ncbi:MAG TPA: hypothetical protein VG692_04465 [Gemmatimonadales bacterium]|nr:hypothetical protein [Gemmatimonadales bacterium]
MTSGVLPSRSPELWWAFGAMGIATAGYLVAARSGLPGPGDLVGHSLGVAGFLLMAFAQVGYSWRKRPHRTGPGPAYRWLALHVFSGLVGPYLVLLHSAFRFRGLAGILSLLTLVVVLSGIAGRYWYRPSMDANPRRALWYLLHVPLSAAIAALAVFHVAGVLYYATGLR